MGGQHAPPTFQPDLVERGLPTGYDGIILIPGKGEVEP